MSASDASGWRRYNIIISSTFKDMDFERIVTEQLAWQIELETAREEEASAASWWAQEKELEESTLLRLLPGSVETYLAPDPDEKKRKQEEDPSDRVAWYVPGMGASTYMAQEYASWDEDADVVRLLAVFGLSEYSNAMRPVLARWIHELAEVTGREEIPDDDQLLGKLPEPDLNALFASLVQEACDADKYIYFYLDDAEVLEALSEVEHRRWMSTVLLTGYRAAPKCERSDRSRFKELKNKEFIHLDIAPYDELAHEADKDRLIVQNIPYIMNGEEIVRL